MWTNRYQASKPLIMKKRGLTFFTSSPVFGVGITYLMRLPKKGTLLVSAFATTLGAPMTATASASKKVE